MSEKRKWITPNAAGLKIGQALGEKHPRSSGKVLLREWVDQELVTAESWPYSPTGDEGLDARVDEIEVADEIAARKDARKTGRPLGSGKYGAVLDWMRTLIKHGVVSNANAAADRVVPQEIKNRKTVVGNLASLYREKDR